MSARRQTLPPGRNTLLTPSGIYFFVKLGVFGVSYFSEFATDGTSELRIFPYFVHIWKSHRPLLTFKKYFKHSFPCSMLLHLIRIQNSSSLLMFEKKKRIPQPMCHRKLLTLVLVCANLIIYFLWQSSDKILLHCCFLMPPQKMN